MSLARYADPSWQPARDQAVRLAFVQRWKCWYCHRIMSPYYSPSVGHAATVEHKVPLSRGGHKVKYLRDQFAKNLNTAAACQRCNRVKGDLTQAEFIRSRAFRQIVGHDVEWSPPECVK